MEGITIPQTLKIEGHIKKKKVQVVKYQELKDQETSNEKDTHQDKKHQKKRILTRNEPQREKK